VEWTFFITSTLACGALVFTWMIHRPPNPEGNHAEPAVQRIRAGFRFVFGHKLLLSAIALDLFAVLFGGVTAILPVFAKDILLIGPEGVGYLRAGMALGAILTGTIIAYRPLRHNAGKYMMLSVAAFGVCNLIFGLSTWFWLSFACLFFAGVFDEVSVYLRHSLMQRQTPDDMKGRVSSVSTIFITSSNEIGAFESGLAASLLGTVPSVIFGGSMAILVVAITWWRSPQLRNYHIPE
jgi:predicted MFS family arabinose efflux permease